ncbi:DUF401 family protein [Treponema sp.]
MAFLTAVSSIPAIVKILLVFALITFSNAKGMHLGLAAFVGAIFAGFLSNMAPLALLRFELVALFSPDTLLLSLLLIAILGLSAALKKTGGMEEIARSYQDLVRSPRLALTTLPALIGVLPMPGGAVFSAPMIDAIDEKNELNAIEKASANYWFRHMIELIWPLYPAFILTASLSGIPLVYLSLVNWYVPLSMLLLGLIFIIPHFGRGISLLHSVSQSQASVKSRFFRFIRAFLPLIIAVSIAGFLNLALSLVSPFLETNSQTTSQAAFKAVSHYGPALIGVSAALVFVALRHGLQTVASTLVSRASLKMITTVAGIKVFAATLSSIGIASTAAIELSHIGVPTLVVTAALPFIAGLVTGLGFGYVGLAFPIVLALVPEGSSTLYLAATMALGGAFGFSGMMLSPLHICMAVSAEHFSTKITPVLSKMLKPLLAFMLIAILYYFLLTTVGGDLMATPRSS